jgi:hypothetical protein
MFSKETKSVNIFLITFSVLTLFILFSFFSNFFSNSYNYNTQYKQVNDGYMVTQYKQPSFYDYFNRDYKPEVISAKFIYQPSRGADSSYWRNKEPYFKSDYKKEEYGYDYYYQPRLNQDGFYNWRY